MLLLILHPSGFQSTLPVRGATAIDFANTTGITISIHAPREGSDFAGAGMAREGRIISIHAPREGSDSWPWPCAGGYSYFNPRSP